MAYNYIEQTFTRTIKYIYSDYYGGGNETAGLFKDFILSIFPAATLYSDNNPVNNALNGTQTTNQRIIIISINGVNKIKISAGKHGGNANYGYIKVNIIQDSTIVTELNIGYDNNTPTVLVNALLIHGVGYFFKRGEDTFKTFNGYILSDNNEHIIMSIGQLYPLNANYTYNVLPSGGYNTLVNNKIILTEFILHKVNTTENPLALRFKNKNIFRNNVLNYFSYDRFYIGDDGHKYALIGNDNLLFQLE